MNEATHRVLKLVENWVDKVSIAGIIDRNGMVRRDDFWDLEKWMYQPRAIWRHNERTQFFFKMQT